MNPAYFWAACGVALLNLWSLSIALHIRFQVERKKSAMQAAFIGFLFGPFAAVFSITAYRRSLKNAKINSHQIINKVPIVKFSAVLSGLACVLVGAILGYVAGTSVFGLSGDALQLPISAGVMLGSLLGGVSMAFFGQRIAVIESLLVLAVFSTVPIFLGDNLLLIFNSGTAIAYFALILIVLGLVSLLMFTLGGALGFLMCGDGNFSGALSFERFIGFRFLMAKRSGHVVSMITVISVFAVTVGCAGMVVVMSVMDGFSSDLRKKILGTTAHLVVMKYGDTFRDYRSVMDKTTVLPGVIGASPYILNEVMISSETSISGAVIKGIDTATVDQVSIISANITEGSLKFLDDPGLIPKKLNGEKRSELDAIEGLFSDPSPGSSTQDSELPGIIIGIEMAKALHLSLGNTVTVVSPVGEMGPSGPIPKSKVFRVAGIFFAGMYEYDTKFVYISLSEADLFFGAKGSVSGIEYKLAQLDHALTVAAAMKQELGGYPYYTRDWMQMNRNLFSALKLEKIAMFIILIALIFMASLLILVALVMVVMEKGKEIAILKSIGVSDLSVMKIFVTYGITIGSVGALLGVGLGLVFCWLISAFGIGLDPEVYYISELPVRIDFLDVSLVGITAIIISFLATIPPSLYAAKLRPVEGLRYD